VRHRRGELEAALADYGDAIRLRPDFGWYYRERAEVHLARGDLDGALDDLERALEQAEPSACAALEARLARLHLERGQLAQDQGEMDEALDCYRQAVEHELGLAEAHDALAWLLATCPDESVRDGAEAVRCARRACELTGESNASYLDTLAAACATAGDFGQAVQWAERAVELAPPDDRPAYEARREMYRAGQAYHGG
jgi:tetratricopeptide (TPR) repeat protein